MYQYLFDLELYLSFLLPSYSQEKVFVSFVLSLVLLGHPNPTYFFVEEQL